MRNSQLAIKFKPQKKSSKIVSDFLIKNQLHKKEFAQMIGVTLSYVYNLIDENVPFSTRSTTLERIAIVMDINPEEFDEYQIPSETEAFEESLLLLKEYIRRNKISTLEFLKSFERKKRLDLVDILRGVKPLFIDYASLKEISNVLNLTKDEFFNLWKMRFVEYLKNAEYNFEKSGEIIEIMFECAYQNMD